MIITRTPHLQWFDPPVITRRLAGCLADLWWSCEGGLPDLGPRVPARQQRENERELSRLTDGLISQIKGMPASIEGRQEVRQRMLDQGLGFMRSAFGFEQSQLEIVRRRGLIEMGEDFARAARAYDPAMRGEDIYQASRNVLTAGFMQMLLGLPVALTPAIFAYSMLYPYTDNYLDDPAISFESKAGFNRRFWLRLSGQDQRPANPQEERIWDLVGLVEGQWPRARYAALYHSLLAIHAAQGESLRQLRGGLSPYEVDVLRISFEKGGSSVLADGYLVAGELSEDQAEFMFGYGAFTQLMDDLEDVETDRKAGFMTIFSQSAGHWPLDAITSRAFHFGARIFGDMAARFPSEDAQALQELVLRALNPLLSVSAAGAGRWYSPAYLRELETHMPFRFQALRDQRRKLERRKLDWTAWLSLASIQREASPAFFSGGKSTPS